LDESGAKSWAEAEEKIDKKVSVSCRVRKESACCPSRVST
jgi:hypothetical protein